MALYAFDGTGKSDDELDLTDSNVVCFSDAYIGKKHYEAGVGTRFGHLGKVVGGIAGAGGRSRISEALEVLEENLRNGDRDIDVIGFSRGAALAIHFTNQVCRMNGSPRVRFLGLFDTVPSFGVPGNDVNLHWDLDCPDNIDAGFHALALDERRQTFPLHRLNSPKVMEVWFRGVHSDVGGGNQNTGLSSIALNWMFQNAIRSGLNLDMEKVRENAGKMKPDCPISIHRIDLIKQPFRSVAPQDLVHSSVTFCADSGGRQHNNPLNVTVVNDSGHHVRVFHRTAEGGT